MCRRVNVMRISLAHFFGAKSVTLSNVICLVFLILELSQWQSVVGQAATTGKSSNNITVCRNTASGLGHTGDTDARYISYRDKYTNCTYLDGSLEIVFLDNKTVDYDLSFLKDIREITGYVLIVSVYARYIPLTSLRIIRGQERFGHDGTGYSIYVALNYNEEDPWIGLQELGLTSLREVLQGHVFFHNNRVLCHENTVEWRDILPDGYNVVFNDTYPKKHCGPCAEECRFIDNRTYCWGPGPGKCQQMTKLGCSPQCDGRCMGNQVKDCCAMECAGGCTGPGKTDCLACKRFQNDGSCELACPPAEIYSKEEYRMKPNPNFKYSWGSMCVKSCPSHLIASKDSCELECEPEHVIVNGKCEKCSGPCPKTCNGTGNEGINSINIESFHGCTIIQGNLRILSFAFIGDSFHNIPPLKASQLSALSSVQEVTEYIQIQPHHEQFTDLSFLRNLRVIQGRQFTGKSTSLQIYSTSLRSLDLVSLESVSNGNVVIASNPSLCFVNTIDWTRLIGAPGSRPTLQNNRNDSDCAAEGLTCSPECSSFGCWGPRDDQCFLECAHFRLGQQCISSCDSIPRIYQHNDTECKRCHPECKSKCTDNLSSSCDECLNVMDGPYCVSACPELKYPDQYKICQPCHPNCEGGCTGSKNTVGRGACNSCAIGRYLSESDHSTAECMAPGSECENGFYRRRNLGHDYGQMRGKQGCIKCHSECLECDGPGNSQFCLKCRQYREDGRCVQECSFDHFLRVNTSSRDSECVQCHARCLRCVGPSANDCLSCKEYLVYRDPLNRTNGFECMETCPDHVPDKVTEITELGEMVTVCISDDASRNRNLAIILGCVIGGALVVTIIIMVIVVVVRKRAKTRESNLKMVDKMYGGGQELEPVSPSGVKPDLSKIRLIRESELRRGGILGSGAFGTVYKGLWVPENEGCKMIVAIKVLLEGTSPNQNEELISEARIMASVENDYCIRILAFCMASQMMIVTRLMPLGCLLDFVRTHKKNIGSKLLLTWCSQIAQGMAYLEEISIVHRDLAARNVLVQTPEHIRITDFGLSKLLDHNENVVTYTGGKMPIKWLALESIQHKLFTHKSDVWSYGVTLWELFTYGQRPYEAIDARIVADLLEKGERLPQPSMCTLDVYMILIKCWVLEAASRPSFKHLHLEFEKMSHDSSRYLIIENDGKMSLPVYTYDEKAVLRSLSLNDPDGPEKIVSPDDYINPVRTDVSRTASSASDWAPTADAGIKRVKKANDRDNASSSSSSSSSPWKQKESLNGDRRNNSRYCSDPCKAALKAASAHRGNKPYNSGHGPNFHANSNGVPFSTDDYLLPCQPDLPVKYLDLADSADSDNPDEESMGILQPPLQPITPCVSNPEYFDLPNHGTNGVVQPDVRFKQKSMHKDPSRSKPYYNSLDDDRNQPLLVDKTSCL